MTYRVFISHGWGDLWVAKQIEHRIRELKAATFIDAFDIAKGDDFEDRIFAEMDRIDELVVLLTPWSVDRNWVWVEIGAARAKGRRIVPILYRVSLDEIDREKGGTTILRSKNAVEINELETYFAELKRRVARSAVTRARR